MSSDENPLVERPDDYSGGGAQTFGTHSTSSSASPADAAVLIVKDCDPWEVSPNEDILAEFDVPYRVIESGVLADEHLDSYSVMLIPSTQPQEYYNRLAASQSQLEAFVSSGGVLVAHTMHSGWPCSAGFDDNVTYLPGDVGTNTAGRRDRNYILAPEHPIVEGLSHEDLFRPEVSYVELTDFPEDTSKILRSNHDTEETYIEYEYGNGRVLATGNPMEGAWAVEGHGPPKQLLRNELQYVTESASSGEITASVTTLQFIPGRNENATQGGHPLNGGLMQLLDGRSYETSLFGHDFELSIKPVLDSWLKGDQTAVEDDVRPGNDELPIDLKEARQKVKGKYADEFGRDPFHIYRFENEIDVSFETSDGQSVDEQSVNIEFNEQGKVPADNTISLKGRENPTTVTPVHQVNGIPVEDWHGDFRETSNRKPRYYEYETDFEFDGVEGVRVLTISGGYAGFVADWAELAGENPALFMSEVMDWGLTGLLAYLAWLKAPEEVHFLADYLTVVPNTYSFIEFIVLADGRRYARVWDASQYPSLATYLDGERKSIEKMPYDPRDRLNLWVTVFLAQASAGITPYHSPLDFYGRLIAENDPERFEEELGEEVEYLLEILPPVQWTVADFLPRVPRETVGFHANGEPVENPSEPFGVEAGLLFPWSGTIESE